MRGTAVTFQKAISTLRVSSHRLSAAFTFNAAPYSSFSSNTTEAVMAVGQALPFLLAAILNFTPSLEGVIGSAMVIVANPCLSLFLP